MLNHAMNTHAPSASTLALLKAMPRPVWILFAGTFLNKFGSFVVPFLALYMTRQGFSTWDAGVALGAYGVGSLLACVGGGYLADTFGRRKTIVLSMFSAGAAMLALSQAGGFLPIIVLTLFTGLAAELYRPASSALLTDLVPAGQRVTAFSAYRMAFNAGWAFGPATAGFLAGYSFFWLFVGDAFTSILFGVVALFCLPRDLRSATSRIAWGEMVRTLRRDRAFLRAMAAGGAIGLVFLQMASTYGLYVTSLGYSDKVYGALLSLNGVLVVCCELPITSWTRRFPARRVMSLGYFLVGAGFASNAFASTLPTLVAAMVVFTIGEMILIPVASAYVADLAPAHLRGSYLGVWGLTSAVALIFGPSLGMMLFKISPTAVWLTCGALGAIAAWVISIEDRELVTESIGAKAGILD
jgi:MFS family permease